MEYWLHWCAWAKPWRLITHYVVTTYIRVIYDVFSSDLRPIKRSVIRTAILSSQNTPSNSYLLYFIHNVPYPTWVTSESVAQNRTFAHKKLSKFEKIRLSLDSFKSLRRQSSIFFLNPLCSLFSRNHGMFFHFFIVLTPSKSRCIVPLTSTTMMLRFEIRLIRWWFFACLFVRTLTLFRCYSDVIPAFHPIILVSLRVRFSRTDWSSRAFTYVFDFFNYLNLCTSVFFDGTSPCACRRVELYVQS